MDATSSLEQRVAKVLKEELREDENTREQSLEQLREWIHKNPDIRDFPTGDRYLLPLLRVRKYSVPMAEQSLIRLLKFQHNFPSLNYNLDIDDPNINDVISSGNQFISPFRDTNGERVFIFIAKHFDLKKHNYVTLLRSFVLNLHAQIWDETTQILGTTVVVDYSQVSPAYFTIFPVSMFKDIADTFGRTLPLRIKKVHVMSLPTVATWFIKLVMAMFSAKVQSRFIFHSSLEELHQHVNPSVLPKELGGTMPMDEMIGLWKKELAVHREPIHATLNIKLVGDSFKNDLGYNDSGIPNLPGSFRTLAVD